MKKVFSSILYVVKYIFIYWLITNVGYLLFSLFQTIGNIKLKASYIQNYSYLAVAIFSILFVLIIYKLKGNNLFEYCRYKRFDIFYILPVIFISISICLISIIFIPLIIKLFPSYNKVNSLLQNSLSNTLGMVIMILVAPIFEETFFRGLIFNKLRDKFNIIIAIIVQALIFGTFHGNIVQFLYTFLLGIFLGFIVYKTDSLIASIFAHVCFNLFGGIIFPLLLQNIESNIVIILLFILSAIILTASTIIMNKRSYGETIDITNLYVK